MNAFFDNFLKKTAWLWLPFYALYGSIVGIIEMLEKRDGKK